MIIKFEYSYDISYNWDYSEVSLTGNGEWHIDEELLSSEYSAEKSNYSIEDFIESKFEYMTELRWDSCKFDSDNLNNLIKFISITNED
jgi:hypothetical protein